MLVLRTSLNTVLACRQWYPSTQSTIFISQTLPKAASCRQVFPQKLIFYPSSIQEPHNPDRHCRLNRQSQDRLRQIRSHCLSRLPANQTPQVPWKHHNQRRQQHLCCYSSRCIKGQQYCSHYHRHTRNINPKVFIRQKVRNKFSVLLHNIRYKVCKSC